MGAASSSTAAALGLPASRLSTRLGVAALALAAVALGAVAWHRARPRRRRRLRRQQVGTVAQVCIYPVKSCMGVQVDMAECTTWGLRSGSLRDRFWLVIKEDGHMVTARQEPRLVLVSLTYENDCLIFKAPDMEQLVLPTTPSSSSRVRDCRLFGLDIQGRDCGDEVAQWFTRFLKSEAYRLVQFETKMKGRLSKKILPTVENYQVAYPDASPVHILSYASLEDLNTRLQKKAKMEHFRPNIVVTGCGPFEEDTWEELVIGEVELKKVLCCSRCIMTTVDPDTGVIDRKEPLDTLKSYRLCDPSEKHLYKSSPLFGVYYSVTKVGNLRVGDPVYRLVEKLRPAHSSPAPKRSCRRARCFSPPELTMGPGRFSVASRLSLLASWLPALALAAVALGAVAWHWARPRRRQQVGTVAQLCIYPVKSGMGVQVDAAECTAMGLRRGSLRDRFWLVINEEGNMVTARQEPRLVLISPTCDGDTLTLRAEHMEDLLLPIRTPATNALRECRVHGLDIQGRDCGEAAARWITSFLKTKPYRLVHFEPHMRPRSSHRMRDLFRPTDQVAYSDASPFLVLSEASLADLNSRLEKKVKASNFRPNIVITGCDVFAEDSWNEVLIGDVELKRVMACTRCILTTVDPDTGVMTSKEPLETLRSYRQCDPSQVKLYGKLPLFGQYYVLEKPGTIKVGDPVFLLGS
ncbi:mitochondrial amidoxime-reducing component 1 [Thomomys bottae]